MIHEWRSYRLKPGAASDYLTLLADQGLPFVTRTGVSDRPSSVTSIRPVEGVGRGPPAGAE